MRQATPISLELRLLPTFRRSIPTNRLTKVEAVSSPNSTQPAKTSFIPRISVAAELTPPVLSPSMRTEMLILPAKPHLKTSRSSLGLPFRPPTRALDRSALPFFLASTRARQEPPRSSIPLISAEGRERCSRGCQCQRLCYRNHV